jgi:DNA-binding HxlR family transcriptional regulator
MTPGMANEVTPRLCNIAAALEVVGDRWSLLIVRELFYGQQKFTDIVNNTGAPRDILAVRLRKLEEHGVLDRKPYSDHPLRYEYRLTAMGRALSPVLLTLKQWGQDHIRNGEPDSVRLIHRQCDHEVVAEVHCRACGERLSSGDLQVDGKQRQGAAEGGSVA